jgi:hypothetical protein
METVLTPAVAQKPRQTMLPLLVALFLISYFLLTGLVVFQGRTIDSQRGLIHLLFKDNLHLTAMKPGVHKNPAAGTNQNPVPASAPKQTPPTQTPSAQAQTPQNQVSATATPSVQVPVIQATPQASAKSGRNSRKAQKAAPALPPAEITDPSDMRRVSISI